MNIRIFKSKMALYGDTNGSLAKALRISSQRCSAKVNSTNGAEFTQSEISTIKSRWNLTAEEIDAIFFAN